jgi:hypothetical protein
MAEIPKFEEFQKSFVPNFADFQATQRNPSDTLPIPRPPTPTGLRPNDAPPPVPTAGTESIRNLPRSIANATAGWFGGQDSFRPPSVRPGQTFDKGSSAGNFLTNTGNALRDTGEDVANVFRHPVESFANDPIATANTIGAPAQLIHGGIQAGRALTATDPAVATTRALRPPPNSEEFPLNARQAISRIKAVNPGFRPGVENGEFNVPGAASRAITAHQDALEPWLQRMEGTTVPHEPIVEATRQAIGKMLPSEQQGAQPLIDRAAQDYSGLGPRELRSRLALINERLSPFYNKSAAGQSQMLADIPDAVLKAQRDSIASTLYNHLDPENAGAGPRAIQSDTGNLINFRDAAARRGNAIVAEQPLSPIGKFVDPIKSFVRHMLPMPTGSGLAFSEGSEGRSIPMLRRAFNAVPSEEGANALGELPRPGPRLLNAATDTSGPVPAAARDFSSVGSEFEPKIRLLPAATSPVGVSGTIVPDIIGRSSRGAGGPRGLLPAPAAGQPPVNVLPRGPGAIGPTGSVPVQSTETPLPAPGVLGGRLLDYLKRGPRLLDTEQ